MKKISAVIGAVVIISLSAQAQVLLSSGLTYSQNFDSLASSGSSGSWSDNTTLPGWYASKAYSTSTTPQVYGPYMYASYRVDSGANNSGNLFSYGVAGVNPVTDRALGSIASGTVAGPTMATVFGLRIKNDTASPTFGYIGISFTGEQWRQGGNVNSQVIESFSYAISSTGFTSPLSADPADPAYTHVSVLDFTSPNPGTATAAALDGNATGNYTPISYVLSGITLNPGDEIMLRWYDINNTGNDHGGGIDNLTISVPEPSCLALAGLGLLTLALRRRRD
jgi:uncharacterized protein